MDVCSNNSALQTGLVLSDGEIGAVVDRTGSGSFKSTGFLWKEFFRDPSQFWDKRHVKLRHQRHPMSPDFRNKHTKQPLWINSWQNPIWVNEELKKCGLKDEELCNLNVDYVVSRDRTALLEFIKACVEHKNLQKLNATHTTIIQSEWFHKDPELGSALISMYAKCGQLAKACDVFECLESKDTSSWNAMISGYAQNGLGCEALTLLEKMINRGFSPNAVTYASALKACGSVRSLEAGEGIHAKVTMQGLLDNDVVLGTALVDMYAKCGALLQAQDVFDGLTEHNVISWNALITGYVQHGHGDKALQCFQRMRTDLITPDRVTYACILKACGITKSTEIGEEIHAEIKSRRMLERDVALGNALVDMYAKCGSLDKAQCVFNALQVRNVITWTSLINGYVECDLTIEALSCFEKMRKEAISADAATFVCILKAYSTIGLISKGEEIHAEIMKKGLLQHNVVLGSALVDMYAKCGSLKNAAHVFEGLQIRDVSSFTALIAGYAQTGDIKMVFSSFSRMISEDNVPNPITFITLLNACSHAGLLDEGQMLFYMMINVYYLDPILEHETCMIDLFCRSGHISKALATIEKVPPAACLPIWSSLLGSCWKWLNVELARQAFECLLKLDENHAFAYVCMGNILAAAGMQEEADKVETLRMKNGAWNISW